MLPFICITFPFDWSSESAWLLSSSCSQSPLLPLGQRALAEGQLLWCCILGDYFTCCLLDSVEDASSDCPMLQSQHKPLKKQAVAGSR